MSADPSPAGGEPATPDQPLPAGMVVGEYEIRRVIGDGSFGKVYAAEHPVIGKPAAVKVLHQRYMAVPEVVSRFVAEARAVNKIRHRNIIDVFSIGKLDTGQQYLIMELLDGRTLDRILEQRGRLTLREAYPILRGIADGLDAAHAVGIVHRDLKPENVFVSRSNDGYVLPKLLDFGIAKLLGDDETFAHRTKTGVAVGTPLYMSPEQCRAKTVDTRTDVYAFGGIVFRCLTGTVPYDGDSAMDVMFKHMSEAIPRLSERCSRVSAALDAPVARMLAKNPKHRQATAGEALRGLVEAAVEAGVDVGDEAARISQLDLDALASDPGRSTDAARLLDDRHQRETIDPALDSSDTRDTIATSDTQISARDEDEPSARRTDAADHAAETRQEGRASGVAASTAALSSIKALEDPPTRRRWVVAALGAAAVLASFVAFGLDRDSRGEGASSTMAAATASSVDSTPDGASEPPAEPPSGPSEAPAPEPEPALPDEVKITLTSSPPDAAVRRGDEVLIVEDGVLLLERGDTPITLTIRAPGRAPRTIDVTPDRDQVVDVALERVAAPKVRQPPPPVPSSKPGIDDVLGQRD